MLSSHGSSRLLHEKFTKHSDGYTEYICRCGKPATAVNHRENLYKCIYCKDNADIVCIPTTWSSKTFIQEIESIGVGIKRIPRPFTYSINDDPERSYSTIETYDLEKIKNLTEQATTMVNSERLHTLSRNNNLGDFTSGDILEG